MTGWSNWEATGRPIAEVFRVLDAMTRETVGDAMQTAIRNDRTEHLPSDRLLLRATAPRSPSPTRRLPSMTAKATSRAR